MQWVNATAHIWTISIDDTLWVHNTFGCGPVLRHPDGLFIYLINKLTIESRIRITSVHIITISIGFVIWKVSSVIGFYENKNSWFVDLNFFLKNFSVTMLIKWRWIWLEEKKKNRPNGLNCGISVCIEMFMAFSCARHLTYASLEN